MLKYSGAGTPWKKEPASFQRLFTQNSSFFVTNLKFYINLDNPGQIKEF